MHDSGDLAVCGRNKRVAMKVIPFNGEHLKIMEMREHEKKKVYPFATQAWIDFCSASPYSATLMKDGRIVTCLGLVPLWEGVYDIWQIPSVYVEKYPISYVKCLKHLFTSRAEELNAHRFQSACPDDKLHNSWMKFMGFECEGVLRQYNIFKDDYKMWSKLWAQRS